MKSDVSHLHCIVASVLYECCIFNERFLCFMQHEINVAASFFPHNQWVGKKISIPNILYVTNGGFYVANGAFLCCRYSF
jgi:hypothetical protein